MKEIYYLQYVWGFVGVDNKGRWRSFTKSSTGSIGVDKTGDELEFLGAYDSALKAFEGVIANEMHNGLKEDNPQCAGIFIQANEGSGPTYLYNGLPGRFHAFSVIKRESIES